MLSSNIRQLEYVLAVAKHGSVTLAAQHIHVSQPALSVAINNLEAQLGQALFIRRKGSPLLLTSFGRDFIQQADRLVTDFEQLTSHVDEREHKQHFIIGCFEDLAPILLGGLLKQIEQQLPMLNVDFITGNFDELSKSLQEGKVDLVISYHLGLESSFDSQTLSRVQPHAILPEHHPLLECQQISIQELAKHDLVLVNQSHSIWHMIKLFRQYQMEPHIKYRVASYEIMRNFVANELGIGLSYTQAQNDYSYDGKKVLTRPLVDQSNHSLGEPVVLASRSDSNLQNIHQQIAPFITTLLEQSALETRANPNDNGL
jgi:DNA-binding transcriptional LysR family regulator